MEKVIRFYQGVYKMAQLGVEDFEAGKWPIKPVRGHRGHIGIFVALEDSPKAREGETVILPKGLVWHNTREDLKREGKWNYES